MNMVIWNTVQKPIDRPAYKVLFQPLSKGERLRVQIAAESIVYPLAIGLVGGIIILFNYLFDDAPVAIAYVMVVSFAGWVMVSRFTYRYYFDSVKRTLNQRMLGQGTIDLEDPTSIRLLKERLKSDSPIEVSLSLNMLEKVDQEVVLGSLGSLLRHARPEVRTDILHRIESRRLREARGEVETLLEREDVPEVKASAISTGCAIAAEEDEERRECCTPSRRS